MLQKLTIRQKKLAEYLLIVAGTAVIAVSLQFFLDPDGMVPGGFTGIAIIVKELTKGIVPDGVPLWVTNLILNVPMVPIVLKINGWDFAKRTVVGSLLLSFWLAVIPYVQLMEEPDLFLTSVLISIHPLFFYDCSINYKHKIILCIYYAIAYMLSNKVR